MLQCVSPASALVRVQRGEALATNHDTKQLQKTETHRAVLPFFPPHTQLHPHHVQHSVQSGCLQVRHPLQRTPLRYRLVWLSNAPLNRATLRLNLRYSKSNTVNDTKAIRVQMTPLLLHQRRSRPVSEKERPPGIPCRSLFYPCIHFTRGGFYSIATTRPVGRNQVPFSLEDHVESPIDEVGPTKTHHARHDCRE